MTNYDIPNFKVEKLSVTIQGEKDKFQFSLIGQIDMEYPQHTLDPFFKNVHEVVIKNQIKNVVCQIQDLEFINSSGIRCFASWIMEVNKMPADQKYNLNIIYNPDIHWHLNSFQYLSYIAPGVVKLTSA